MDILISGATGIVGRALVEHLLAREHRVTVLSRGGPRSDAPYNRVSGHIRWNPPTVPPAVRAVDGFDALIHLAGEPIAARRWTVAQRKRIDESRVAGTRLLMKQLHSTESPPPVVISASAVGYYGDTGERTVDEKALPGTGFTPDVCRRWEAEALAARGFGSRVILLRTGIVLSERGGALARMLPIFRAGLGGRLGNGLQWMSWITAGDLARVVAHCLDHEELAGPVNAVSPEPVRNRDFTRALARQLGRPALAPAPATVLRLMYGRMAEETLLASQRVRPALLEQSGFTFETPGIEAALRIAVP